MRYKKLILILFLISTSSWAKILISPIYDGEFNMDKSACWLENSKQEIIVYGNDSSSVKIKNNGEIVTFYSATKNAEHSNLKCGKKIKFYSKEKSLTLSIKLQNAKTEHCLASMTLSYKDESKELKKLKLKCSR